MHVIKTGTDTIHQSIVSTTCRVLSSNLHLAGPLETANDQKFLPHSVTVSTATVATHELCILGKIGRNESYIISHQPSGELTTRHKHQYTARSVRSNYIAGYIPLKFDLDDQRIVCEHD